MRTIIIIFALALTVLCGTLVFGQTSCPGPAIASKPGSEPSPETRFFAELARLDGVLADGQILQGCILDERVRFEVETGRGGTHEWEAPLGEVVGYLPELGEEPRVLLWADGEFELRPGRLVSPLTLRSSFRGPLEVTIEPEHVELFILRGVYQKLPLIVQARLLSLVILSFQQLRTKAELIATRAGGVFSGEVLTQEFSVQLRSGETRRLHKGDLGQLTVLRVERLGVYAHIYLRSGQLVEGLLRAETARVRFWKQEVELPLSEVHQVVFRNETLLFGGGELVQFCSQEPC